MQENPDYLGPILTLTEDTTLKELSQAQSVFTNYVTVMNQRFEEWYYQLNEHLWKVLNNKHELIQLKVTAHTIIHGQKIIILRRTLEKEKIWNPEIEKKWTRLNTLINRVLEVQPIQTQPHFFSAGISTVDLLTARISHLNPNTKEWQEKLTSMLFECADKLVFVKTVRSLTFTQFYGVFSYILKHGDRSQIPALFFAGNQLVLIDFLALLDKTEIDSIKSEFLKHTKPIDFQNQFVELRETIISECNKVRDLIDELARVFRTTWIADINTDHLTRIEILAERGRRVLKVANTFALLIRGMGLDTETLYIPNDVKIETTNHLARLSPLLNDRKVAGNLYVILTRRAFGPICAGDVVEILAGEVEENLHLNDPIEEGLIKIKVNSLDDYSAAGIFKPSEVRTFKEGIARVKSFGLNTVADLINNKIYNATLLKEFINDKGKVQLSVSPRKP
jgi:hypothetical protein